MICCMGAVWIDQTRSKAGGWLDDRWGEKTISRKSHRENPTGTRVFHNFGLTFTANLVVETMNLDEFVIDQGRPHAR